VAREFHNCSLYHHRHVLHVQLIVWSGGQPAAEAKNVMGMKASCCAWERATGLARGAIAAPRTTGTSETSAANESIVTYQE